MFVVVAVCIETSFSQTQSHVSEIMRRFTYQQSEEALYNINLVMQRHYILALIMHALAIRPCMHH